MNRLSFAIVAALLLLGCKEREGYAQTAGIPQGWRPAILDERTRAGIDRQLSQQIGEGSHLQPCKECYAIGHRSCDHCYGSGWELVAEAPAPPAAPEAPAAPILYPTPRIYVQPLQMRQRIIPLSSRFKRVWIPGHWADATDPPEEREPEDAPAPPFSDDGEETIRPIPSPEPEPAV